MTDLISLRQDYVFGAITEPEFRAELRAFGWDETDIQNEIDDANEDRLVNELPTYDWSVHL